MKINYSQFKKIKAIQYWYSSLLILSFLVLSGTCFSQTTLLEKKETLYSTPPTAGIIEFILDPKFSKDNELKLALYDLGGVLEKSTTIQLTKETTVITWDTNKIGNRTPTGIYLLDIIGNNQKTRKRLVMDCGCRE